MRAGQTPQAAIAAGYERAWGTILDSNVTTMIAGLALLRHLPGVSTGSYLALAARARTLLGLAAMSRDDIAAVVGAAQAAVLHTFLHLNEAWG